MSDWKSVKKEANGEWNSLKGSLSNAWSNMEEEVNSLEGDDKKSDTSEESKEHSKKSDQSKAKSDSSASDRSQMSDPDPNISRCSDLCMLYAPTTEQLDESAIQKLCTKGCKLQSEAFKTLQDTYKKTQPDLLLGTALDKCWDGCSRGSLGKSHCVGGCDNMKILQKRQLSANVKKENVMNKVKAKAEMTNNDINKDKEQTKDETNEIEKNVEVITKDKKQEDTVIETKDQAIVENAKGDDRTKDQAVVENALGEDGTKDQAVVENEGPSHMYVLWRPRMTMDEDPFQGYVQMVNIINTMLDSMNIDNDIDQEGGTYGWKDDRKQLNLPSSSRTSALSEGEDEGDFYDRMADSLETIKDKVEATIAAPGFREDMYYVLIGLCGFLLLTTAFNSVFYKKRESVSDEDHYFLHAEPTTAKLPSYDDCIKADKELLVDMTGPGELPTKVNLCPPSYKEEATETMVKGAGSEVKEDEKAPTTHTENI